MCQGFAPGSWSQVAISRTQPNGRVIGIDIIPAQPPRGVSTIQGNFLDPALQAEVRAYVQDPARGRPHKPLFTEDEDEHSEEGEEEIPETIEIDDRSYIDMERQTNVDEAVTMSSEGESDVGERKMSQKERDRAEGRVVDVVLSDMSDPWPQTTGSWVRSVSDPYNRMMNTSGISFKDHAGSMVGIRASHDNMAVLLTTFRTCALPRCPSPSIPSTPAATSFASSIKGQKRRLWRRS